MITLHFHLQLQYKYEFHVYISHHFTGREDMNSTNWPRYQCVASQLSWSSIASVSRRSWVRIPLKPWYFQASSFQFLKLEKFIATITPHFHLQLQYKYDCHMYFTMIMLLAKLLCCAQAAFGSELAIFEFTSASISKRVSLCYECQFSFILLVELITVTTISHWLALKKRLRGI